MDVRLKGVGACVEDAVGPAASSFLNTKGGSAMSSIAELYIARPSNAPIRK